MKKSVIIQSLNGVKLEDVRQSLIEAFSDYSVPMNPNLVEFRNRMQRNAFRPELSAGVFQEQALKGFILSGVDTYNLKKTIYNAGTGVAPELRGQKLTLKMYDFLLPLFKEQGIEQSVLEVISTNSPAINAYKTVGFQKARTLDCYVLAEKLPESKASIPLKISKVSIPDWEIYSEFLAYQPSWQFTPNSINRVLQNEIVLEATSQTQLVGFISFTPHTGRICLVGVHEKFRGKKVGTQLLRAAQALCKKPKITILNIDSECIGVGNFLLKNKFKHFLSQYEMVLSL